MNTLEQKLKWVLGVVVVAVAAIIYIHVSTIFPSSDQRNIRLEELFALTALVFLYLSLFANPLAKIFPNSSWVQTYKQLQPALVTATLFFGLTHFLVAFFYLLGGFGGLAFLNGKFILGIILSATALLTLIIVFTYNLVSSKYKWINNWLYLVGILISIHALLLGSDFAVLSELIPKIFIAALILFLALEIIRFDRWANAQYPKLAKFGPNLTVLMVMLAIGSVLLYTHLSSVPTIGIHAGMDMSNMNMGTTNMPGMVMTGDASKRYTVSFAANPPNPTPNENVNLTFKVYDASSGAAVTDYTTIYTKLIHLVIVDSSLTYYSHIHPVLNGSTFSITTQFPKDDIYHLYINFQPNGATEQQFGFTLPVGAGVPSTPNPATTSLTGTFDGIQVTMSTDDGSAFSSSLMNDAAQILDFDFKDATTGQPISDLQPYLGAFGHLTLINEQTYAYVHIHPISSNSSDFGGPEVKFLPAALFEKITPGVYRVFGQFMRNNKLFVADFTIKLN